MSFKINSRPLFTIIFKLKYDNFMTRDFSPLIKRVITGVRSLHGMVYDVIKYVAGTIKSLFNFDLILVSSSVRDYFLKFTGFIGILLQVSCT